MLQQTSNTYLLKGDEAMNLLSKKWQTLVGLGIAVFTHGISAQETTALTTVD